MKQAASARFLSLQMAVWNRDPGWPRYLGCCVYVASIIMITHKYSAMYGF